MRRAGHGLGRVTCWTPRQQQQQVCAMSAHASTLSALPSPSGAEFRLGRKQRERERARAKGATSWGQPASRWALISGVRAALGAVRWEMPPRILVFLVVVFDDVM